MKVPCTGCGYCMPCPHGVDIPTCFAAYNTRYTDSFYSGMKAYIMCTTLKTNPTNASKCRQCGKCEKHCPQSIAIRQELKQVAKKMENPVYKVARAISKRIGKY
nr:4Fe-4S dicluster domain-containing protein [Roseburia sp. AF42-8]